MTLTTIISSLFVAALLPWQNPAVYRLQEQSFDKFKQTIINETKQDASRFKPNVLAQNEERHAVIARFIVG